MAQPEQTEDKVNLAWIIRYDALLNLHGSKLSPPKKPGDHDGIVVEGDHYKVSQKVLDNFNRMKNF